ncbi:MAG: hypothetical protein IMY72_08105 [Bacteroidetes bacterium]|nr:hypothetical protein [Bacteroidota bacterium]
MNKTQIEKLINILYIISTTVLLVGLFWYLKHYSKGRSFLMIGFMMGTATSFFDNYRLKKRIKELEEQKNFKD